MDTFTLGSGANTLLYTANTADETGGIPSATLHDTINGWAAGTRTLDSSVNYINIVTGVGGLTITNGLVTAGAANLTAFLTGASASAVANSSAVWSDGTSSWLFVSDGTAGLANTDQLIQLVGVNATTGITITAGDITAIA